MSKYLKCASILASLMVISLILEQGTALATEVERYMGENSSHLQLHRVFDARLSPLQEQGSIDQADQVVLHVDCGDLKTLQLLQKPFYDIDLAGEDINLDKLRELLPISSQILALNLMETRLKDDAFPIIEQLTTLTSLILSDNPFGDAAMPSISSLSKLRSLEMVHTKVTDVGLESLLPLKNLEKLDAGCNLFRNAGIRTISQIPSLIDVDVRACEFDATVLPLFFGLPKLQRLNISGNKLERKSLEIFLFQAKERGIEVKAEEIL